MQLYILKCLQTAHSLSLFPLSVSPAKEKNGALFHVTNVFKFNWQRCQISVFSHVAAAVPQCRNYAHNNAVKQHIRTAFIITKTDGRIGTPCWKHSETTKVKPQWYRCLLSAQNSTWTISQNSSPRRSAWLQKKECDVDTLMDRPQFFFSSKQE